MVDYFVAYAERIAAPVRCGVTVSALHQNGDGTGFRADMSEGVTEAVNVVAATGPFQHPIVPALVPPDAGIVQVHSRPVARGRGAGGRGHAWARSGRSSNTPSSSASHPIQSLVARRMTEFDPSVAVSC
jgi:hypothetical protein